jgi:pimeloyl-ACP methyl ester carboxylesterase
MHAPFLSSEKQSKYLQLLARRAEAWPTPCETRVVETPSARTFVRINGPADAPPLLLLPGGGTNSLMWTPNVAGLSRHFRTFAVDSPIDVGQSLNLVPFTSTEHLVGWLDELLRALGLGDDASLMGLSHGAWLAANFAQRHPTRVRKLVLVAPAAWVAELPLSFVLQMVTMLLPPRRFWIRRTYLRTLRALAATEAGRRRIDELTEELATAFECFGLRRMSKLLPPTQATDDELGGLRPPTLFIVGEHETIYDARTVLARLERVAPQVQRAVVEGVGHDLTWAKPEVVEQLALDFLRA